MFLECVVNRLQGYQVQEITELNAADFVAVLSSNPAYFALFSDDEVGEWTCIEMMNSVPPDFDRQNKLFLGATCGDDPVAVVDLLLGYPESDVLWIGLLLIHRDLHGQGIGKRIDDAIVRVAAEQGYESAQLAVIDGNQQALEVWKKLGYKVLRRSKAKGSDNGVWVLGRELANIRSL